MVTKSCVTNEECLNIIYAEQTVRLFPAEIIEEHST